MIIHNQTISFDSRRRAIPQLVHVGLESDNMVERLEFVLPEIGENQTATLLLDGIPDGVTLAYENGRYIVDLTASMLGTGGVIEGYVRIDASGAVWNSDVLRLRVGELPDVDEQIEQKYPTAVTQMLEAINEHRSEMTESLDRVQESQSVVMHAAAQAVAAANSAELAASLAGEFTNDAESAANSADESEKAAREGAKRAEAAAEGAGESEKAAREGAKRAEAAAEGAGESADNAAENATAAQTSATNAGTSAANAETSAQNAKASADRAEEAANILESFPADFETLVARTDGLYHDRLVSVVQVPAYKEQKSNVTANGDGTLTIAAGGYYFVGFEYASYPGTLYLGVKSNVTNNWDVAFSTNGTSGASPYVKTQTVNGCEIYELGADDRRDGYPYIIVRIDNRKGTTDIVIEWIRAICATPEAKAAAFVSPNGDDRNAGTLDSPYATVNHALKMGASIINVLAGVYEQRIDFANAVQQDITIQSYTNDGRAVFVYPDRVIASAESAVSGYTKVYSASTSKTFADGNDWIFQDGVNDEFTLITDEERHPLQRGYAYRCHDTKITRCTSTALSDALAEIESSAEYKWFFDASTSTIYFSRPATVSAGNPLCGAFVTNVVFNTNTKRDFKLTFVGIECKYMYFNLNDTVNAEVIDCKASNVYGTGAFRYDRAVGAKFVRCEAVRCYAGSGGDGFNAHSSNTGDAHSKQTTVTLIDCWSHDNNDDGYSDHERSETTVIGGLYEYNGKAGVTPAGGSHCTCYNVHSRRNYNGFVYTNSVEEAEGGVGGQLACYGCVAENNDRGDSSNGRGFLVTAAGNSMTLVDCSAIGGRVGYVANSNTRAKLVNCRASGVDTVRDGDGVLEVVNAPEVDHKNLIDDEAVSLETAWSSKEAIDRLCPEFLQSGDVALCQPVEGYPLHVVSHIVAAQAGSGDPSPDNVRPISGWDAAIVTRTVKNLFGGSALKDYIINKCGGTHDEAEKTVEVKAENMRYETLFTAFKPNTQYTVMISGFNTKSGAMAANLVLRYTDGTRKIFEFENSTKSTLIYTTEKGKTVSTFDGTYANGRSVFYYEECGIFEGILTADDFEPYQGETYTAQLPETVYGGAYDWKTGVLTVTNALLTLNGTENWKLSSIQNNIDGTIRYDANLSGMGGVSGNACVASHYPYEAAHRPGLWVHTDTGAKSVGIRIMWLYDSVDALKTYLAQQAAAGTPVTVVYELAAPYSVQLEPQDILALGGTNTLYSSTGETDVSGRSDPRSIISSLEERLAALEAAAIANI